MSDLAPRQTTIKNHYPTITLVVLIAHILGMVYGSQSAAKNRQNIQDLLVRDHAIKLQEFRRVGRKDGTSQYAMIPTPKIKPSRPTQQLKKQLSLSDLSAPSKTQTAKAQPTKAQEAKTTAPQTIAARPGTRPDVASGKPAIEAITLRGGTQLKRFSQGGGSDAMAMSGTDKQLESSNVQVKLEVPEGVPEDQLNEYELKFYSFQKRTAQNYINSLFQNVEEFQKRNPHLHFPMTNAKQVMTGRLTYDEKGNIKQIKMVRWSNDDRVQKLFEEILKDMDTLHNPPHLLWEKTGEFSVFFTLQING
jgi:hypothetical protein